MQQNQLDEIIKRFRSSVMGDRHQALIDLAAFPFDDIRDIIFEALKDNNHRIRAIAAKIIGKMGDETVVPPILHMLYDDSWIIRSSAQEALSQLPSKIALPAFRGILAAQSGDTALRKNIASVLGRYDTPEATEILVQLYSSSSDQDLRASIIEFLGRRKEDKAVKTLFDSLADENWNVRSAATKALINMDVQAILAQAAKALSNPNRLVHMAVIEILIRHGNDDVIDMMAKVMQESNILGRLNALNVLAGIKSEESMSMIVSVLGDQNSNVRRRAAEVLSDSHTPMVFQLLKRCIKSENWNLKQGAIKTLGMIASDEALDLLEQLLKTGNSAVKLAVLESLASIGNNRCVRLITENLSLPELGEEVLRIIKTLDPDQAITQLISFLTEQTYFKQVIAALANLERPKVLRYLASKVGMGTPMQQLKAVEAIGELGGSEAEVYLKKLLDGAFSQEIKRAIQSAIDRIQRRIR